MNILITRGHNHSAVGWRIWEIVGKHQTTGRPLVMDWEGLMPTAQRALDRVTEVSTRRGYYPVTLAVEPLSTIE